MTGIATPEEIHAFWFPEGIEVADEETTLRQVAWWFRGGADPEIVARFGPTLEAAISGQLDVWAKQDGKVLHFWGSELGETSDPGEDPRGAPDPTPLWNLLDLTPGGRGTDWYPKLSYPAT